MKEYIELYPDTFLWFNRSTGLFYNCKEKTIFNFGCSDLIYKYCVSINDPTNLYVISLDEIDRQDPSFLLWIDQIEKNKMGVVYSKEREEEKPISFPPILNLRNEIEEFELNNNKYYSSINYAECLNEMSFFFGGEELPVGELDYYKQVLYPFSYRSFLELNDIRSFLQTSNITHVYQINIICNDLLRYADIKGLVQLLVSYAIPITYYLQGRNVDYIKRIISILKDTNSRIKLYFFDIENFKKTQDYLKDCDINYGWIFLIKNEEDLFLSEKLICEYNLEQTDIWPVLTNSNIDFFKENVYTSLDDIDNASLTKQNIFCNQVLNTNYWGHLFILPDGRVYGNLNTKPLGTVKEDAMELIKREIKAPDSSWKCTRKKIVPCKECVYRNLCPPPSGYEFYLNTFNLCMIR